MDEPSLEPPLSGGIRPPPFRLSRTSLTTTFSNITTTPIPHEPGMPHQRPRIFTHPLGMGGKFPVVVVPNDTTVPPDRGITPHAPPYPLVNSFVAGYLIVIIVLSIGANLFVLFVSCGRRSKGSWRSSDLCTVSLALTDSAFALSIHTVMATGALGLYNPQEILDWKGCILFGGGSMFFGTFTLCLHASVSLIRYLNLYHPHKTEWIKSRHIWPMLVVGLFYSAVVGFGPMLEWQRYSSFEFGCTVKGHGSSHMARIFAICGFALSLVAPLCMLILCYFLILIQAYSFQRNLKKFSKDMKAENSNSSPNSPKRPSLKQKKDDDEQHTTDDEDGDQADDEKKNTEKKKRTISRKWASFFEKNTAKKSRQSLRTQAKLIRVSVVCVGAYLLSWLPYATICFCVAYGQPAIPEVFRLGASLLNKSSTVFNPFIYYMMSDRFRSETHAILKRLKSTFNIKGPPPIEPRTVSRASSFHSSMKSFGETLNEVNRMGSYRKRSIPTTTIRRDSASTSSHFGERESTSSFQSPSPIDHSMPFTISSSPSVEPKRSHRHSSSSNEAPMERKLTLPPPKMIISGENNNIRRLSSSPYRAPSKMSRRASLISPSDIGTLVPSKSFDMSTADTMDHSRSSRRMDAKRKSMSLPASSDSHEDTATGSDPVTTPKEQQPAKSTVWTVDESRAAIRKANFRQKRHSVIHGGETVLMRGYSEGQDSRPEPSVLGLQRRKSERYRPDNRKYSITRTDTDGGTRQLLEVTSGQSRSPSRERTPRLGEASRRESIAAREFMTQQRRMSRSSSREPEQRINRGMSVDQKIPRSPNPIGERRMSRGFSTTHEPHRPSRHSLHGLRVPEPSNLLQPPDTHDRIPSPTKGVSRSRSLHNRSPSPRRDDRSPHDRTSSRY